MHLACRIVLLGGTLSALRTAPGQEPGGLTTRLRQASDAYMAALVAPITCPTLIPLVGSERLQFVQLFADFNHELFQSTRQPDTTSPAAMRRTQEIVARFRQRLGAMLDVRQRETFNKNLAAIRLAEQSNRDTASTKMNCPPR